jgi:hypothetical protein
MSRDSAKLSAAQLGANLGTPHHKRRRRQSAWLLLAWPPLQPTLSALRTPITLVGSVLQPEETVLPYTRTHDDGESRARRSAPRLTLDQVRAVTDEDIGLRVLRNAPADAAEIVEYVCSSSIQLHANFACSIVAVHGIGAHPDDSWCKNVGAAECPRRVNWLDEADMLPAVAPHARIMRYGYQSQWFGEGAMRQKASTVAQRLLLALRRKREVRYACLGGVTIANSDRNIYSARYSS